MIRQTTPILYGVFTDLLVMQTYVQYLREMYENGMVSIMPKNGSVFQKQLIEHFTRTILMELPSGNFKYDTFIGGDTDEGRRKLLAYMERNDLRLNVTLRPPTMFTEYLTVAAVFEYIQKWPSFYFPHQQRYTIPQDRSFTGNTLEVNGFLLSNVSVGKNADDMCVSVRINMGDGVMVTITKIDAFKNHEYFLQSSTHYGKLFNLIFPNLTYIEKGYLLAPCVDCTRGSQYHLNHMSFVVDGREKGVIVESEMYTQLQLSKDGIYARSETTVVLGLLGGESPNPDPDTTCVIDRDFVLSVTHKDQPVFVAFVPQQDFFAHRM